MTWYPCKPTPGGPPGGRLHLQLCNDPAWAQEPKFDGVRCIASVSDGDGEGGEVRLRSRTGKPLLATAWVIAGLRWLDPGEYDGELMGGEEFLVFDLPCWAGETLPRDWADRRWRLEHQSWTATVRLVPLLDGAAGFAEALDLGAEGVVLKRRASLYPRASRIGKLTRDWFKIKGARP